MDVLPLNFRSLAYCGLWLEDSSALIIVRKCWGFLLATIIFYFTLTEIIELYLLKDNVEELVDVMFMCVTYVCLCLKIINFSFRRKSVMRLLDYFRDDLCTPKSEDERILLEKYSFKISDLFKKVLIICGTTGLLLCSMPFIILSPGEYELPLKTYQFYDDSSVAGFSVTYAIQLVIPIFGILINVSMDTMIYGFIILATGQFELISCRIIKFIRESNSVLLNQCVRHHAHVKSTVREIEHTFMGIAAPLFFFSLLTLCGSIFQMAKSNMLSVEFLGFGMYLLCMLLQVFLYCWYGNELKLESLKLVNTIYEADWVSVKDQKERKKIHIFMISAQKGSSLSWQGQCSLSLDTFVWIIKTSYTAFNLLQRASEM